ncbi:MAG: hypothetical protein QOD14_2391 [Solirubrobacterales bacterium]|jgi:hypothetical protein|nr:hypothetical protein [Solirubrobacterales bacterium]
MEELVSELTGGDRVPQAPAKRTLLFLHVPKAGGTALGGALGNRFAADECLETYYADDPSDEELNAARYMTGHISMSVLDRFEQPPFSITVLRDPIERALSIYSFFRELDEPSTPRLGLERNDAALRLAKQNSLEEFIEVAPEIAEHYLGNWQARMLGGKGLVRTDERLEDALAGLRRCDFVGLAERQNESIDWLTRRLGWAELTPLPLANVTRTKMRREQISPAAMEALLDLTSVDRDLYAEAVRLYERRVAEWEAAADVQDGTAEIEDARLVSDLRFEEPIRGSGWLGRERVGDQPHFCWIGHTASARVELADDSAARSVAVEIRHVIDPAVLGTLRITVDGEVVPHRLAESGDAVVASAPLARRRDQRDTAVRVELAVDHATRPCDVDRSSNDSRDLAIAVRRIALSTRSAA